MKIAFMHQILFIHGGGEDGYHADMALKDFLLDYLDARFKLNYPQMPSKEDEPDLDGWIKLERRFFTSVRNTFAGHGL